MTSDLDRLAQLEALASLGGGPHRQKRQQRLGHLLVRERVELVLDHGSFLETGAWVRGPAPKIPTPSAGTLGDGVVCGTGEIKGRPVAIYAHDPTVQRGALGVGGARKIVRLLELAADHGLPVIAIHDSDGVRVNEGPAALAGFAHVLGQTARLSGWVPQIGVVLGICVGGAAYSSALQDVVIGHREQGFLFVTGAKVTQVVTGENDPIEDLGGVPMHARRTGLISWQRDSEADCLQAVREVLSFLPQNADGPLPLLPVSDPLDRDTAAVLEIVPTESTHAYDMRRLLGEVLDRGSLLELQSEFAPSLLTGFARFGGRPVGVVASQPSSRAGCLDIDSSRKGARFIQLCNAFGLPIFTFADVPGFLPGRAQEQGGLLLHGAKLIAAYAACTVPLLSVIVRKSYGGGNVLAFPADIRLAYPFARVQPMGTKAALEVATHSTFGEVPSESVEAVRASFVETYDAMHLAAEAGVVDRVIHPRETRRELARALYALSERPQRAIPRGRRQVNIPL